MSSNSTKCVIVLSSKSSGSTALQQLLSEHFPEVRLLPRTRHFENETLFWTKAASVLGLPQVEMLDSEVPFGQRQARAELVNLLNDNLDSYTPPEDADELVFGGWELLCKKYSPVFLEKSPHHLHQWSALELIAECIERLEDVDFLIVGLVRNPMDTLYSAWSRWRIIPEKNQYHWLMAYENLIRFKDLVGDKLVIVRYEDMVRDVFCLKDVFEFIGIEDGHVNAAFLHGRSVGKWRTDKSYGFVLSDQVASLAETFGYRRQDLANEGNLSWWFRKHLSRSIFRCRRRVKRSLRAVKRGLGA